jgi:hypothetical protein
MKKISLFIIVIMTIASCNMINSDKEIQLIPYVQNGKYGFFDMEGKIVINPQFEYATVFRENLALVKTTGENGKWGYIDNTGKFVINANYIDATVFKNGLAWVVSENSAPTAIEKNGEIKFVLKQANRVHLFSDDLAAFSVKDSVSNENWGFVDKSGVQIINPQFREVGDFSGNLCAVKNKDGKWGYIDKSGKIVINYQFDNVEKFIDGKAIVYLDNKAGVIDNEGKYIINPQFSDAIADKKLILISQDKKFGWCDEDGKFVINPQFESAQPFNGGDLACIQSGDKYGFIDENAKIVINPQFDYATSFFGKVSLVKLGSKFGLIDKDGKYKVNPMFDGISMDFFEYLYNENSVKNTIETDFLDIDAIIKVINVENPENLSFNDGFNTIISKLNKTQEDFSAYNKNHTIFSSKKINSDASYSFALTGNVKAMSDDTYEFYITNEKPDSFDYTINLFGNAYGKAETFQKAFENKLKGFNLVKKGYAKGRYASVFKGPNSYVILWNLNLSTPIISILKPNFDITYFLNQIKDKQDDSTTFENDYEDPYYEERESTVVDTTSVYVD